MLCIAIVFFVSSLAQASSAFNTKDAWSMTVFGPAVDGIAPTYVQAPAPG